MMTTMKRRPRSGVQGRAAPASRGAAIGRRLGLVVLALVAVVQEGCRSSGCGSGGCGPCARLRARLFPGRAGAVYAEPGLVSPGVTVGSPGAVVTPAPGAVVPQVTPAPENLPELAPADSSSSVAPPAGESGSTTTSPRGASSSGSRTSYDTQASGPRSARSARENLAQMIIPHTGSASRPARSAARPAATALDTDSVLDHLPPPVDLPAGALPEPKPDAAKAPEPAPVATSAAKPAADPPEPAETAPSGATAPSHTTPETAAEPTAAAASRPEVTPPRPLRTEVSLAPIPHFTSVGDRLAGGSAPTPSGLDWLVEKGYKTLLDLREPDEVPPSFLAEVHSRGLRYLPLPVTLHTVDRAHVDQFRHEVEQPDARPLYFFDGDGSRAGLMWYIQRRTVDQVDIQTAADEARELGIKDPRFFAAATAYIEEQHAAPVVPAPSPSPSTPNPAPASDKSAQQPARDTLATSPAPAEPSDPNAWRPYAAMILAALGIPLAFISRTGFSHGFFGRFRASLPAPARRPRSLPGSSDD